MLKDNIINKINKIKDKYEHNSTNISDKINLINHCNKLKRVNQAKSNMGNDKIRY